MNDRKLRAKLVENDYTIERFSSEISINTTTFYRKISNSSFTIKEVQQMMKVLSLNREEVFDIFFD